MRRLVSGFNECAYLVGGGDELERQRGSTRFVWVGFKGLEPVGPLQLRVRGVRRDAQYRVVVLRGAVPLGLLRVTEACCRGEGFFFFWRETLKHLTPELQRATLL